MDNLIKDSALPEKDVELLREKFKSDYADRHGWDKDNLTSEQMFEITTQKGWKSPGLILG